MNFKEFFRNCYLFLKDYWFIFLLAIVVTGCIFLIVQVHAAKMRECAIIEQYISSTDERVRYFMDATVRDSNEKMDIQVEQDDNDPSDSTAIILTNDPSEMQVINKIENE